MRVFREEVFGPVTPVFKFGSDDGAAPLRWWAAVQWRARALRSQRAAAALPQQLPPLLLAPPPSPALALHTACMCLLPTPASAPLSVVLCAAIGAIAEAVELANDTEYGLAAYFFTRVRVG